MHKNTPAYWVDQGQRRERRRCLRAIALEAREREKLGLKEEAHALRWVADAIKDRTR